MTSLRAAVPCQTARDDALTSWPMPVCCKMRVQLAGRSDCRQHVRLSLQLPASHRSCRRGVQDPPHGSKPRPQSLCSSSVLSYGREEQLKAACSSQPSLQPLLSDLSCLSLQWGAGVWQATAAQCLAQSTLEGQGIVVVEHVDAEQDSLTDQLQASHPHRVPSCAHAAHLHPAPGCQLPQ